MFNPIEMALLKADSSEHLVGAMAIFKSIRTSGYRLNDFTIEQIEHSLQSWERFCKDIMTRAKAAESIEQDDSPIFEKDPHQDSGDFDINREIGKHFGVGR